jgi:hypothetical protein
VPFALWAPTSSAPHRCSAGLETSPAPRQQLAEEGLTVFRLAQRFDERRIGVITRRRILYALAAMVVLLVVGTVIGLIWADESNIAGAIAVATNIVGVVGVVVLLIALAVNRGRPQS